MKRVVVLGAYGLIGNAVVDGVMAWGDTEIVAVGRRAGKMLASVPAHPLVERLVLDLAEHARLGRAVENADLVIN